jgi:hypothetical protein
MRIPVFVLVLAPTISPSAGAVLPGARTDAVPSGPRTQAVSPAAHAGAESEERAPRALATAAGDGEAIEAFRRGDLEGARSAWLARLAAPPALSDSERARILYNLGNVAFRKGELLPAVGWYTASLRLRPRDGDTWQNLEHARSEAGLEPADRGDLAATVRRLLSSLTLAESEWFVLATAGLWAAALAAEALRGGRLWRRLSIAGAALVAASLAPWLYNQVRQARDPVLALGDEGRAVQVRSEPRADAAVIGETPAGSELERTDELPSWTKVELESGLEGWIPSARAFPLQR